jgi:hypothetical protein
MLLTDRISMQLLHRIPNAVHPPIVALAPCLTDDMVGSHFADYPAGGREVLDLLDLGFGFGGVFQLP